MKPELLDLSNKIKPAQRPSLEEAPGVELKVLPEHLKYIFLGEKETLSIIISTKLTIERQEALMQELREHRRALGWTQENLKGISLSNCMQKIRLEERSFMFG